MCNARRKFIAHLESTQNACGLVAALRFPLILKICVFRYVSQIFKTIVIFDAVNMIYLAFWPLARHVKPRKSVAFVDFTVNRSNQVPFVVAASRNRPAGNAWLFHFPRKCAFMRVVIKHLFEAFLAQHVKTVPNFYGAVK